MNQTRFLGDAVVNGFQFLCDSSLQRLIKPVFVVREEIIPWIWCITDTIVFQQFSCPRSDVMAFECFGDVCSLKSCKKFKVNISEPSCLKQVPFKSCATNFCDFDPILTARMLLRESTQIVKLVVDAPHSVGLVVLPLPFDPSPGTVHKAVTGRWIFFHNRCVFWFWQIHVDAAKTAVELTKKATKLGFLRQSGLIGKQMSDERFSEKIL